MIRVDDMAQRGGGVQLGHDLLLDAVSLGGVHRAALGDTCLAALRRCLAGRSICRHLLGGSCTRNCALRLAHGLISDSGAIRSSKANVAFALSGNASALVGAVAGAVWLVARITKVTRVTNALVARAQTVTLAAGRAAELDVTGVATPCGVTDALEAVAGTVARTGERANFFLTLAAIKARGTGALAWGHALSLLLDLVTAQRAHGG